MLYVEVYSSAWFQSLGWHILQKLIDFLFSDAVTLQVCTNSSIYNEPPPTPSQSHSKRSAAGSVFGLPTFLWANHTHLCKPKRITHALSSCWINCRYRGLQWGELSCNCWSSYSMCISSCVLLIVNTSTAFFHTTLPGLTPEKCLLWPSLHPPTHWGISGNAYVIEDNQPITYYILILQNIPPAHRGWQCSQTSASSSATINSFVIVRQSGTQRSW